MAASGSPWSTGARMRTQGEEWTECGSKRVYFGQGRSCRAPNLQALGQLWDATREGEGIISVPDPGQPPAP